MTPAMIVDCLPSVHGHDEDEKATDSTMACDECDDRSFDREAT